MNDVKLTLIEQKLKKREHLYKAGFFSGGVAGWYIAPALSTVNPAFSFVFIIIGCIAAISLYRLFLLEKDTCDNGSTTEMCRYIAHVAFGVIACFCISIILVHLDWSILWAVKSLLLLVFCLVYTFLSERRV